MTEQLVKIGDAVITTTTIKSSVGEYRPGLVGVVVAINDQAYDVEFRLLGFMFLSVLPKDSVKLLV